MTKKNVTDSGVNSPTINHDQANLLTLQKHKTDLENKKKMESIFGATGMVVPDVYTVPVFPTEDKDGKSLHDHKSIFPQGSLLHMAVYLSEIELFEPRNDPYYMVVVWNYCFERLLILVSFLEMGSSTLKIRLDL